MDRGPFAKSPSRSSSVLRLLSPELLYTSLYWRYSLCTRELCLRLKSNSKPIHFRCLPYCRTYGFVCRVNFRPLLAAYCVELRHVDPCYLLHSSQRVYCHSLELYSTLVDLGLECFSGRGLPLCSTLSADLPTSPEFLPSSTRHALPAAFRQPTSRKLRRSWGGATFSHSSRAAR